MRIEFIDRLTRRQTNESSAFTVVAKFYDDSTEVWTASTPTSVRYRVDDGNYPVRGWTTGTPGTSLTINLTYSDNAIISDCSQIEQKTLTVQCDTGLSTQYQGTYTWSVKNLGGQV